MAAGEEETLLSWIQEPSKGVLLLRKLSEELLSPEIQSQYLKEDSGAWVSAVIKMAIRKALTSVGFEPTDEAVKLTSRLWHAYERMGDSEEARKNGIAFIVHARRQYTMSVKPGDPAPDVTLHHIDQSPVQLSSFFPNNRPLVVATGSYT
eukprot:m.7685 g.7685  ORF g.7685 m.7685 type:complete len:150 (+) comp19402_c0_seq2:55-504(+)